MEEEEEKKEVRKEGNRDAGYTEKQGCGARGREGSDGDKEIRKG